MRSTLLHRMFLAAAVIACVGCQASYPTGPAAPAVTAGLEVRAPAGLTAVRVGRTFSYTAIAIDSDGVFTDVTAQARWVSTDPVVARAIDGTPQFRAIEPGVTDLFAEYRGFTAKAAVTVVP